MTDLPLHRCRLHLPPGHHHPLDAFSSEARVDPVARPFVDRRGRAGFTVELPDVYTDTKALARRHVLAALAGRSARLAATSIPLPQRRELLHERLHALLPVDSELEPTATGSRWRQGDVTIAIDHEPLLLTVSLPRVQGYAAEQRGPLCDYAARIADDVAMCRLDVTARSCGFAVRIPTPPLAVAAPVAWSACRALLALARTAPPLTLVVATGFRPLLELAGPGRSPAPVPQTPERA